MYWSILGRIIEKKWKSETVLLEKNRLSLLLLGIFVGVRGERKKGWWFKKIIKRLNYSE